MGGVCEGARFPPVAANGYYKLGVSDIKKIKKLYTIQTNNIIWY